MNKFLTAVIFGIALAGVAAAQGATRSGAANTSKTKIAVVEFTPGPNASGMTAEAKRQLQASIAFELTETKKFDVVDVRNTRSATQASLAAINGDTSTAAAVKAGRQLGVSYVLTGVVSSYDTKGSAVLSTRLVEVATGKVRYSGETTQQSTSPMRGTGAAEMQTKVLKPAIEKLTQTIASEF